MAATLNLSLASEFYPEESVAVAQDAFGTRVDVDVRRDPCELHVRIEVCDDASDQVVYEFLNYILAHTAVTRAQSRS